MPNNATNLSKLLSWVQSPGSLDELRYLLRGISNEELTQFILSESASREAGTLAWMELGSRKGYVAYDVTEVRTDDALKLEFKATAAAVSQLGLASKKS